MTNLASTIIDGRRVRVISDFEVRNSGDATLGDRSFKIGDIVTKRDVDAVDGYVFNPEAPGFFELLLRDGLAELVT